VAVMLIVHPWTFSRTVCHSVMVPGHRRDILVLLQGVYRLPHRSRSRSDTNYSSV